MEDPPAPPLILVTGATGYVGGRLVPRLVEAQYRVRCLVRDPTRVAGREWRRAVEVVTADALRPEPLPAAFQNVTAAYYLIHSMAGGAHFAERDVAAARHFGRAAAQAGVKRIIYLGGLGDPATDLSPHLRSRQQTGAALREGGVPVTEFRAGVIVGSGSLSFELVRSLTERMPLIICPKWVFTRTQPIAIRNVLDYLVAAFTVPESADRVIEIGGADVLTYADMILHLARARGLKRVLVPVPFLTPRLSSLWIHLVTPVPAQIARPLVEGLRNEVIVRNDLARQLFPNIRLTSYDDAVAQALATLESGWVLTRWSDALSSSPGAHKPVELAAREGLITERRQLDVWAGREAVYRSIQMLGGEAGWLYMDWAWRARGLLDRLAGGVGLRRGRRDPELLRVGEALDFWRVEALEPNRLMRLRAEMKLPGRAWLEFEICKTEGGRTQLAQTAFFAPKGLAGLAYWYILYPFHRLIFSGMIRRIAHNAEALQRQHAG